MTSRSAFCTIVARNYLPAARVLAKSLASSTEGQALSVLLIDDRFCEVDGTEEPFEVWRLRDLGASTRQFNAMAASYSVTEFATAVKPWFLSALLDQGFESVVYLDPDTVVYESLEKATSLARTHDAVLTPHAVRPMPRDGKMTDETAILAAGIYNLGFIGVGQDSRAFLEFWKERLEHECVIDPANQRFVDQRWVDFAPGMFDCHILRDPTYNVAYWNLDHRPVEWDGERYKVAGESLTFFHFSGFDPDEPHVLSKHQCERPRILLSEFPAVRRLCEDYADRLRSEGAGVGAAPEYGFRRLPNGLVLTDIIRQLYQRWGAQLRAGGDLPPDPFTSDGSDAFLRYLTSPEPGERLPRYLACEYRRRLDLQIAFPEGETDRSDEVIAWAEREVMEGRLDPRLGFSPVATSGDDRGAVQGYRPGRLGTGVCVAGYLRAELGMGQVGRLAYEASQAAGLKVGSLVYGVTGSRQLHPIVEIEGEAWDVNVIAVNADQLPDFVKDQGPEFVRDRYNIGLWAWELEAVPEQWYGAGLPLVDEIWVLSDFERRAIAGITDKPVHIFPLAGHPPPVVPVSRAELGLPEGPMFLFCFDAFSVVPRKNPAGLIDAFARAFGPGSGPTLVIKVLNAEYQWRDIERLKLAAADRNDIIIVDRYFDHDQNVALLGSCDAYVSLHRSEGFGLTMFEAMSLGKPVIATAYSGNLDFMTDDNSFLVPWHSAAVPEGCDPYPAGYSWADPDVDAAARLMRKVFLDPGEALRVGARGAESVRRTHGPAVASRFVSERFAYAQSVLEARGRALSETSPPATIGPAASIR